MEIRKEQPELFEDQNKKSPLTGKMIELIAVGACIISLTACNIGQLDKTATNHVEVGFQDDYGNRNIHYTCLSHGPYCTDGDGIYAKYGDPYGPTS